MVYSYGQHSVGIELPQSMTSLSSAPVPLPGVSFLWISREGVYVCCCVCVGLCVGHPGLVMVMQFFFVCVYSSVPDNL